MVVAPVRVCPYTSAALNRLVLCALCAAALGCSNTSTVGEPPQAQLYFPSGLAHVDVPGSEDGVLYVANGNFDKRFRHGTFVGLQLDAAGLPPFGAPVPSTGPAQLGALGLPVYTPYEDVIGDARVNIASFAGELGVWKRPDGSLRFFVPSRSEGDYLQVIDGPVPAAGASPSLRCRTVLTDTDDCWSAAFSMTAYQDPTTHLPRATAPYGVAVAPDGEVFVTHLSNADSPKGSNKNLTAYVVRLNAETLAVDANSFVALGPGTVNTAVVGKRWIYLTGRALTGGTQFVRLVDRESRVLSGSLEAQLGIAEARGISLSSDETRLYFAGRGPDRLVVASVTGADTDAPVVRVMRAVPLPAAPNQVLTIPRPGRSDLVVVSCSTAGVVAIYDDDLGGLVAQVPGVGLQPFSIAADRRGAGVRLYVSNFADGRVAVIDVPDLEAPQVARLVAHLSKDQLCLTRQEREGKCTEEVQ